MASRLRSLGSLIAGAFFLVGCASSGFSPLSYSVQRAPGVDRRAVFEAAETALLERGYKIDRRDLADLIERSSGVLRSVGSVVRTVPDGDSPRGGRYDVHLPAGQFLSSPNRQRRVVQIKVDERQGQVNIYCRVTVQEQVTEATRMFASQYRGVDIPDDTPIDRDAATTTEQNTVWRTRRRDKAAERRILADVLDALNTVGGEAEGSSVPGLKPKG